MCKSCELCMHNLLLIFSTFCWRINLDHVEFGNKNRATCQNQILSIFASLCHHGDVPGMGKTKFKYEEP